MAKLKIEFMDYEIDKILSYIKENNIVVENTDEKDLIKNAVISLIDKKTQINNIPQDILNILQNLFNFLNTTKINEDKEKAADELKEQIKNFYIKQIEGL